MSLIVLIALFYLLSVLFDIGYVISLFDIRFKKATNNSEKLQRLPTKRARSFQGIDKNSELLTIHRECGRQKSDKLRRWPSKTARSKLRTKSVSIYKSKQREEQLKQQEWKWLENKQSSNYWIVVNSALKIFSIRSMVMVVRWKYR